MKVLEQIRYVLGEFGLQGIIDWAILLTYLIGIIVLLTLCEFGLQGIIDWAILLTYLIGTIVLLTLLIYI
jgi:cytochrome c oxidase subunit IV